MTSSEQQPRAPEADGDRPQDAKQHPPTNSTEALSLVERLDALETWLLDNDLDMKMPVGMISPAKAASHLRELQEENARQGFLLALMAACAEERYVGKDRGQWIRYDRLHEVVAEMTAGYRDLSEAAEALASTYREENARLREGLVAAALKITRQVPVTCAYLVDNGINPHFAGILLSPYLDAADDLQALTTPRTETDQ